MGFARSQILVRGFLQNSFSKGLLSENIFLRVWFNEVRRKIIQNNMPDQAQKNRPMTPSPSGGGDGPSSPKVEKPNTEELLKRMRKVDPDQAKRYRQRTGQ